MTLVTLNDILPDALAKGYAVPGFVCLGWEDARAYVAAAEAERAPAILQAGPGCRANTPLAILGAMFRHLAEAATVPIVAHLDHGYTLEDAKAALAAGFTSVMIDGSQKTLDENIALSRAVADLARAHGASSEGELGFVGYAEGAQSAGTDPDEVARFVAETGVDALAVSVGNVHLQTAPGQTLDRCRLNAIEVQTDIPLVIHGGSGLGLDERRDIAQNARIAKINIGTELRQTFGRALRDTLADDPEEFDRIKLLKATEAPLIEAARDVLKQLGASGRV